MSGRYTLSQREMIIEIKNLLSEYLEITPQEAQTISVDQPFDEFMSSIVTADFIEELRTKYEVELCWGRIAHNPTIDGILELIQDEKEDGYKCDDK